MKLFFAIFFALQMLINSSLAFAHMATDAHDPHEAVHSHMGADHNGDAAGVDQDDEDGAHFHLCAAALNTTFATASLSLNSAVTPFARLRVNFSSSPPVPPPNA